MAIARVSQLDAGMLEIFDESGARTGVMLIGSTSRYLGHTATEVQVQIDSLTYAYDATGQLTSVR